MQTYTNYTILVKLQRLPYCCSSTYQPKQSGEFRTSNDNWIMTGGQSLLLVVNKLKFRFLQKKVKV